MKLFEDNILNLKNNTIKFNNKIINAFILKNIVCILFEDNPNVKFFRNLWGVDLNGSKVWEAENPDFLHPGENYYQIAMHENNLIARSSTFDCIIDLDTGRIIEHEFTK